MLFRRELDFESWFRHNLLSQFGYTRALKEWLGLKRSPYPDYWCVDERQFPIPVERVELELTSWGFLYHKHDPGKADKVICAEDNLRFYGLETSVPVVALPFTGCTSLGTGTNPNPRCLQQVHDALIKGRVWRLLKWRHTNEEGNYCYYCGQALPNSQSEADRFHAFCLKEVNIWALNELQTHIPLASQF